MRELLEKIEQDINEYCDKIYGGINWRYDIAQERKTYKSIFDMTYDVKATIQSYLNDIDEDIMAWEEEHHKQWYDEDIEAIKTDMLYEENNNL